MENPNTDQLVETIRSCLLDLSADIEIQPALIAKCAMDKLDPESKSPILVAWGCNLELRQLARRELRKNFDPIDSENPQVELFAGLQERYPTKRNENSTYVLIHDLTDDEIDFNSGRLYREGAAKIKHADALVAYKMSRVA